MTAHSVFKHAILEHILSHTGADGQAYDWKRVIFSADIVPDKFLPLDVALASVVQTPDSIRRPATVVVPTLICEPLDEDDELAAPEPSRTTFFTVVKVFAPPQQPGKQIHIFVCLVYVFLSLYSKFMHSQLFRFSHLLVLCIMLPTLSYCS